jgi:hypothetical protein
MLAEMILQGLTIMAAAVAILGYLDTRRKYIMEKGVRLHEMSQVQIDVKIAHDKIRALELSSQQSQISSAEMKKDIEYIRVGTDKMEKTLAELRDLIMNIPKNNG